MNQIKESQINDLLQKTLKAHRLLMKKGRKQEAIWVLSTGSKLAHTMLILAGISSRRVQCPRCHRLVTDSADFEAVRELNTCLACDHLDTDHDH